MTGNLKKDFGPKTNNMDMEGAYFLKEADIKANLNTTRNMDMVSIGLLMDQLIKECTKMETDMEEVF